jgi:hypothetical protein
VSSPRHGSQRISKPDSLGPCLAISSFKFSQ